MISDIELRPSSVFTIFKRDRLVIMKAWNYWAHRSLILFENLLLLLQDVFIWCQEAYFDGHYWLSKIWTKWMPGGESLGRQNGPVVVEDTFTVYPKTNVRYHVTLTHDDVTIAASSPRRRQSNSGVPERVSLKDVVGCHLMRNRNEDVTSAYFCIYYYPYRKKLLGKRQRQRQTLTFNVDTKNTFAENKYVATHWKTAILYMSRIPKTQAVPSNRISVNQHYLVLLNPYSGAGRAMTQYENLVRPMFTEAEFDYEMVVTERSNHARDMMFDLPLTKYQGIIVMSGDGLIHEILNGLLARSDWKDAAKIPIGIIPTGSGNALASAILFKAGESYASRFIQHSTFVVLKHVVSPMDLMLVQTRDKKLVSFLSVTWGMIADIDIESEKYRKLGSVRFTVGALMRIINLKSYRGRLSFLPNKPYVSGTRQRARTLSTNASKREMAASCDDVTSNDRPVRMSKSGSMPSIAFLNSRSRTISNSSEDDSPSRDLEDMNQNEKYRDENSNTTHLTNLRVAKPSSSLQCLAESTIPNLSEGVPSSWVTLEEDYVMVTAISLSHLSSDAMINPNACWDDNFITLCLIRKGVTKAQLLNLLTAMEDGSHMGETCCIEFVQVHAFRLEPLTETGRMAVDGEVLELGPVQAQILPATARVMAGP